jgi:hypothetical protein
MILTYEGIQKKSEINDTNTISNCNADNKHKSEENFDQKFEKLKITNKASFYDKFNDVLNLLNEEEESPKENNIMIYYNDILDMSNESLPSFSPPASKEKESNENNSIELSVTRDLSADRHSRNFIPKQLLLDKSSLDYTSNLEQTIKTDTYSKFNTMNNFILNRNDFMRYEDNNRYMIII